MQRAIPYRPLKNGQFGSKIKMSKKMRKTHIYKHTRAVLWKKPLEKTPNIREMRPFFKIGHIAKAIAHDFAKCSVWVKN